LTGEWGDSVNRVAAGTNGAGDAVTAHAAGQESDGPRLTCKYR